MRVVTIYIIINLFPAILSAQFLGSNAGGYSKGVELSYCSPSYINLSNIALGNNAGGYSKGVESGYCVATFINLTNIAIGTASDGHSAKLNTCLTITLLPIELTSFTATCNDNKAILSWTTASEINNDYFTIERSNDAVNFDEVDRVKGAGNSNVILNYQYTDINNIEETTYYRLKQTDFNGEFKYSDIISSYCKGKLDIINTFPNPSDGDFTITISSSDFTEVTFCVYDILGCKLIETSFNIKKGISNRNIDISTLKDGLYYIQIRTSNGLYKAQKQIIIE